LVQAFVRIGDLFDLEPPRQLPGTSENSIDFCLGGQAAYGDLHAERLDLFKRLMTLSKLLGPRGLEGSPGDLDYACELLCRHWRWSEYDYARLLSIEPAELTDVSQAQVVLDVLSLTRLCIRVTESRAMMNWHEDRRRKLRYGMSSSKASRFDGLIRAVKKRLCELKSV
jgi:hypothetical protein